jgi:hypothetical protein
MESFNKREINDIKFCRSMKDKEGIVELLLSISKEEAVKSCYININILLNNKNAMTQILASSFADKVIENYHSCLRTFLCYDAFLPMINEILKENLGNSLMLDNSKKLLGIRNKDIKTSKSIQGKTNNQNKKDKELVIGEHNIKPLYSDEVLKAFKNNSLF